MDSTCVVRTDTENVKCRYMFEHNQSHYGISRLYIQPISVSPKQTDDSTGNGVWVGQDSAVSAMRKLDATKSVAASAFITSLANKFKDLGAQGSAAVFLLPNDGGYVFNSNFMVYRTTSCPLITSAASFISPLSLVSPWSSDMTGDDAVAAALEASIGAVEIGLEMVPHGLEQVTFELERRLALPWFQKEEILPKRVLVVMEQSMPLDMKTWWETTAALGIKIVILSVGDWFADGCGTLEHMREAFISIDMKAHDPDFWKKIVQVVESYPHPIDGIFGPTDAFLVSIAQASEELGLWTPGPQPFLISTDKHATRQVIDPEGKEYFFIHAIEELDERIASNRLVQFPAICKPAKSASSDGVYKVNNVTEMRDAMVRILALKQSVHGVLVERYMDGPEVDVNVVLLDGKVLFSEIIDEHPAPADVAAEDEDPSTVRFQETQALIPSHLPGYEQDVIVRDVIDIVLKQGFKTGVYHCEARVCNSTVKYAKERGASFPRLQTKEDAPTGKPYAFLHEVNARGPAQLSSYATMAARGVDFWQQQMLAAVGDKKRFAGLATPFLHDEKCTNVVMTALTCTVSQALLTQMYPGKTLPEYDNKTVEGKYDPMPDLYSRHNLSKHIPRYRSKAMYSPGIDRKDGEWIWVNGVVICSPKDRQHALQLVEEFTALYQNYVGEMDKAAQKLAL